MTEEQFDKIELIPNHLHPTRGDQWETFGEEYEEVKKAAEENRVITALDVDGGIYWAMGWHYVNRIYYHITKHPLDKMPGLGDISGEGYFEKDEEEALTIYICIEHDESPTKAGVHCTFTDWLEYLADHNEYMGTDYRTIDEFNEGEEFRTIYKSEWKEE